ncbi:hypothetical protein M0R45_029605 [Rubus argutus]|uniref:Uncharacterized protein n=1 Tax=Rubus argutus TaxID=59490 RepID=A0AAW1W8Q9_RUBAR
MDSDENWVIGGDISTSSLTSAIDLESVAVHQMGDLLVTTVRLLLLRPLKPGKRPVLETTLLHDGTLGVLLALGFLFLSF